MKLENKLEMELLSKQSKDDNYSSANYWKLDMQFDIDQLISE
jgi:hypothetical protein